MSKNIELYTKSGLVIRQISNEFIKAKLNEKIRTVSELSEDFGVGRGTVQSALRALTNSKAITLYSRGHLGTFLIEKDISKLLEFSGISILLGAMPLPYSKRYEGLSTAIIKSFEDNLQMPVNMAYMRGAKIRIQMLLNDRYDFAITSKAAAMDYLKEHDDIEIVTDFGKESFLSKHVIMYNNENFKGITDGTKVGLDRHSIDQINLTYKVCKGKNVEFVNINYSHIFESLSKSDIDCAIWNGDEIHQIQNIYTMEIDDYEYDSTIAVLLIKKERQDLKILINEYLDTKEVSMIQKKVLENEIIPSF